MTESNVNRNDKDTVFRMLFKDKEKSCGGDRDEHI